MAEKSKKFNIKRLVLIFWIMFLGVFIGFPLYIITVNNDLWGLYGSMPSLSQLENPENDLSSRLFYANGDEMGKYFRFNRSQVGYDELSNELVTTLLASEDHRFYQHTGIDLIGITRAAYGLITLKSRGGGSTITMQLAENLFKTMTETDGLLLRIPYVRGLVIKTKEWIISTQLEKTFTKEEIIALYLNTVSFGSNAFGIKAAGETFFGKQPSELNYQESAVLIGLLQGTSWFNPVRNPERSLSKRNQVLTKLARQEYFDKLALDSLKNLPIDLTNYNVAGASTGLATYFRSVILWDLLSFCKQRDLDLYDSGLKIYTTIDRTMQEYAEQSVTWWMDSLQTVFEEDWQGKNPWVDEDGKELKGFIDKVVKRTEHYKKLVSKFGEDADSVDIIMNTPKQMRIFSWEGDIDTLLSPMDSLRYYKKFLQSGFMAMDPYTGHIKAWVGGIDHRYFKYDHVKQGKRQPGSTFKPILYATAIENGYIPCYDLPDVRKSYPVVGEPPVWVPQNANGVFSGDTLTIRRGLAMSKNSISAQLMNLVGPENVVNKARSLGITSELDPVLALALGTSDVSVYEMVGAYSAFVNQGTYTKPFYITRIEDKHGNILQQFVPEKEEALSEEDAYIMTYMLRGAVEEMGGTARRLDYHWNMLDNQNEIGAKTGTTQNYSDGWFMGITNNLVAGAWVGSDDRAIHFPSITHGQGAVMALPIWAKFMESVYADDSLGIEPGPFRKPLRALSINLDCGKYNLDELDSAQLILIDSLKEVKAEDMF